uniref:Uncharacterized protein n=1 Tax=Cyclopterus lumpus TaxID=8103 RepID=A0A8C2ZD67_CYCLU
VMEFLLGTINPNNFPAKLWRLVNNPANIAIRWNEQDKGIPVSFSQHYPTGAASNANAMHIQQGLLACSSRGNPNYTFNAQYQMGGKVINHTAGYPVSMLRHVDHKQDSKTKEHQEVKKCDINLDTVFQIADGVMQTPPNSSLVRVVTPQKPGPVLVPFSGNNPAGTVKSNHLSPVTVRADLVSFQQEESVISLTEQLPEDAICEVSLDIVDFLKEFSSSFLKTRYFAEEWLDDVRLAVCK